MNHFRLKCQHIYDESRVALGVSPLNIEYFDNQQNILLLYGSQPRHIFVNGLIEKNKINEVHDIRFDLSDSIFSWIKKNQFDLNEFNNPLMSLAIVYCEILPINLQYHYSIWLFKNKFNTERNFGKEEDILTREFSKHLKDNKVKTSWCKAYKFLQNKIVYVAYLANTNIIKEIESKDDLIVRKFIQNQFECIGRKISSNGFIGVNYIRSKDLVIMIVDLENLEQANKF